ncbi:MAG TPA: chromosomal replication initiator protein DnaA, partial [Deltaproteobacteria bacterium]|nr:chromosomal replication initiator protein DnaA [Deltaproteobacteria bacterium]
MDIAADMNDIIQKVIASLQTKISGLNFNNWIKPATFRFNEPRQLLIEVPNKFIRDWITDNYLHLIKYELFKVTGEEHEVAFRIVEESVPEETRAEAIEEIPATPAADAKKSYEGLNPKYTFDTFVVGSSNQFAHAASRAVANLPALAYNPLFIYGGVGLGKTHLLNAIGLEILRTQKPLRVLYVHAEHFTNELIVSIRYEKMFEFRKKYRESCDVLLIDDVQFIAGKERTQEEFFHTFNA